MKIDLNGYGLLTVTLTSNLAAIYIKTSSVVNGISLDLTTLKLG
jgi:hypothetical protein